MRKVLLARADPAAAGAGAPGAGRRPRRAHAFALVRATRPPPKGQNGASTAPAVPTSSASTWPSDRAARVAVPVLGAKARPSSRPPAAQIEDVRALARPTLAASADHQLPRRGRGAESAGAHRSPARGRAAVTRAATPTEYDRPRSRSSIRPRSDDSRTWSCARARWWRARSPAMHRSPHHGSSVEFAEHKEYTAGDEIKHIDWKAYGKFDRYYIKRFEEETELRPTCSSTPRPRWGTAPRGPPSSTTRGCWPASLGYLLLRQQDQVG